MCAQNWRNNLTPLSPGRVTVPGCLVALLGVLNQVAIAMPSVRLTASASSPQPLGTTVTLTANATDPQKGLISFRFEIGAAASSQLMMVRDFSPGTTFRYTPTVHDGSYQFKVTARN